MTAVHRRLRRLAVAAVVAGLIGMHGLGSGHGVMSMAPAPSMTSASSVTTVPMTVHPAVPPTSAAAAAAAAHVMAAMGLCVALPAGFLALVILGAVLIRRHRERSGAPWRARRRAARSPPCPAPHVRGVCLT